MPAEGAPEAEAEAAAVEAPAWWSTEGSPGGAEIEAEVAGARLSAQASEATPDPRAAFHQRLFALLLRYKTLRGHGFHAAIAPAVWRVLTSRLGVGFEAFASPLNCYLPTFGSGFSDVDGAFGSSGSFFRLKPAQLASGSSACNPPFVRRFPV